MKLRTIARKYGPQLFVVGASVAASPAFAAGESYDTTSALAWIAAAVVAGIALVGAMIGLVTLIGGGKKVQRAGT